MIKKAWAVWKGGIKDGGGTISTETGTPKESSREAFDILVAGAESSCRHHQVKKAPNSGAFFICASG
jgi:hypothetical protein